MTPTSANLFQDGDRWAIIGDSITQHGLYGTFVLLYYLTRFPQMNLELESCGISGDSLGGALRRYEWDIQPRKATVATIMLGMNDVGRHLYGDEPPTPEIIAEREAILVDYREKLVDLTAKLQTDGTRVVFVTPSPFDDTLEAERPRQPGINAALGQFASFMKQLASEVGATVIELNEPMTELNLRLQAQNPQWSVVGEDRVHPGPAGHLVMTHFFLKGQGAPAPVSEIEINAETASVEKSENAEVTDLKVSEGILEFATLEGAIPYPIGDSVKSALDWVPFQNEFNRQILRVTGLTEGLYTLLIEEEKIYAFTADQLATGVNLAELSHTPQARQAAEVLALMDEWQPLMADGVRNCAQVEHWLLPDFPHPVSFEDAEPEIKRVISILDENNWMDAYNLQISNRYLEAKPQEAELQNQTQELMARMRQTAQPRPHNYRLIPIPQ